jgi:hypothetical protein
MTGFDWFMMFLIIPWFFVCRWFMRLLFLVGVSKLVGAQVGKIKEGFKGGKTL